MSTRRWKVIAAATLAASMGVLAAAASARESAVPQNTVSPSISGAAREGATLTAANGSWANSPTAFAYQWQRCASDGSGCGDITGATQQTYKPVTGDVSHTLRVSVTATNSDGKSAPASSDASEVVAAANGPTNTVKPSVSGTAAVGEQLTVSNGTWSATPSSFSRQWQRCDQDGTGCRNIAGATGQSYGVGSADVGRRLRALVTARTSNGGVATATSNASGLVIAQTTTVTTTTTTTTTTPGNRAPTIRFLALRRLGVRVYARFRVCDDRAGKIGVIERDTKARQLSYRRRFAVVLTGSCGTFSRNWIPAPRFRGSGRFVVTLRAVDKSGRPSRMVSRSLLNR
jgi:hypothetical protein